MREGKSTIFIVFTVLLVINAVITAIHYILIDIGKIPIKGDINVVMQFALADVIVTIIPSLVGAYGLWQLKKWGWMLAIIASGGYLHGMIALLTPSVVSVQYTIMNLVSIYFIIFSILLILYLWQQQKIFS